MEKIKLLVTKKEAEAEIKERINEGEEILNTNYISMTEDSLDEMRSNRDIWDDYNKEYLKKIFSNDSIASEYSNNSGTVIIAPASLEKRRSYIDIAIKKRITRLKSIKSRLSLIEQEIPNRNTSSTISKTINQPRKIELKTKRYWDEKPWGKIAIGVIVGLILLMLSFFLNLPSDINAPTEQKLSLKENIKDCGSNIDKEGVTQTLDIKCFAEAFKTCTPAKIYEESFPPDNVPSIKTTTVIEGKTDKGCRIQVNVRNILAIPENNIYYCYSAVMGRADDTQNFNHLVIDNCDNNKTSIY